MPLVNRIAISKVVKQKNKTFTYDKCIINEDKISFQDFITWLLPKMTFETLLEREKWCGNLWSSPSTYPFPHRQKTPKTKQQAIKMSTALGVPNRSPIKSKREKYWKKKNWKKILKGKIVVRSKFRIISTPSNKF